MKKTNRNLLLFLITIFSAFTVSSQVIQGVITDRETKEPLIGVSIIVKGSAKGTATDLDGKYRLTNIPKGETLHISYISYKTVESAPIYASAGETVTLDFALENDNHTLNEITVTAKRNLEGETALRHERINSSFAIENLGAKEMSAKGISNVADGVKKISGISIAEAGQLFVRGLGDRYSITTLNGLPIASPNPDHKLIPLDLFPASTVQNITVSKVYQVASFADYSGAHINISTRENVGTNFYSVGASLGGNSSSIFQPFYHSDNIGFLKTGNLSQSIKDMSPSQFSNYIKKSDPFKTNFSISKRTALPNFGITAAMGRFWNIGSAKLSVLASIGASNDTYSTKDSYIANLTAQGTVLNEFTYDSYTDELKLAGLLSVGYNFREDDHINYTMFYARNAIDDYRNREGVDSEGVHLIGSNSVLHIYSLFNHQLSGKHNFGSKFQLNWSGSYGMTRSDEPDRRQVMFRKDNNIISLFKLNKQETMRYFGELGEDEVVGEARLRYNFTDNGFLKFGGAYKDKSRNYHSTRFYYNLTNINPEITNIYDTNSYLNQENIANGTISVTKDSQPKSNYFAGSSIAAGFLEGEYNFGELLMINAGVRFESARQWVKYWNDASIEKKSELNKNDFFPAANMKFNFNKENSLRFSFSRTITRPSFIEMAPFLYKESYGSAEIRGNDQLQNGYNINIDLRYEIFGANSNDMISVTGYYKKLKTPIERVQESSGGSAVHSFRNAEDGTATGIEVELRKSLFPFLRVGFNASYMYTNVVLPENGGVYTDTQRGLQGASPYLANADITYMIQPTETSSLSIALLYNLHGPRIQAVGIFGMSNIMQKELHTLDFVCNYNINKNIALRAQVKNMLNSTNKFTQELKETGENIVVEHFKTGVEFQIGASYNF